MLIEWMIKISDHGNTMLSKGVYHFGVYFGIAGGTASAVANEYVDKSEVNYIVAFALEYGAVMTFIAGAVLVLKNLSDVVLSWTKAYWERKDKQNE